MHCEMLSKSDLVLPLLQTSALTPELLRKTVRCSVELISGLPGMYGLQVREVRVVFLLKVLISKAGACHNTVESGFEERRGSSPSLQVFLFFKIWPFCSYSARRTNETCALSRKRRHVRIRTISIEIMQSLQKTRHCTV